LHISSLLDIESLVFKVKEESYSPPLLFFVLRFIGSIEKIVSQRKQITAKGGLMVKYAASILALLFITLACGVEKSDNTPHVMTKEQLLPMLVKSDIIVIDVRANYDWDKSTAKIKGAVREEGMKFSSWMNKYPKDKTIIIYCA
jgi:hypothetical protein